MRDPLKTTPPKPRAREVRERPASRARSTAGMVNEGQRTVDLSHMGTEDRKGGEKSEPAVPGTGAGATFSGSRNRGGGVKRGQRAQKPAVEPEVNAAAPAMAVEDPTASGGPVGAAGESVALGTVVGGASWAPAPAEGDPGTGFYRFRKADMPGLDARTGSGIGVVVEVFGRNLLEAQGTIGLLVSKALRKTPPEPCLIRPIAFRRTQLSKKQRRAMAK